jgi:hypothetical protein
MLKESLTRRAGEGESPVGKPSGMRVNNGKNTGKGGSKNILIAF